MANKNMQTRDRILKFISSYISKNGNSPSFREIGEEVGLASSTVSQYVCSMAKEGLIEKTSGRRSIKVSS